MRIADPSTSSGQVFGIRNEEPASALRRSLAAFIIGGLILILLWLPPLPITLRASDLPHAFFEFLSFFRGIKLSEAWPLRWEYLFFPLFSFYALWMTLESHISLKEAGLSTSSFVGALRYLWWPTLLGAMVLLGMGVLCHSVEITPRFWKRLNPIPGFFQQMVIQLFFYRQLAPWFGTGRKTVWILAFFFMILHAPNPGLMMGTLFGMYFWVRCYQQQPNLYALALSHAFLSALLMHTMPKWLLPSVSVGHRFVEKGIAQGWWTSF